ncbi:Na+/H+ antiporter [Parapedobacter indicus]|uniref:Sodium/proton antiporter, CPA1 family n=1 Tax=Parapedobacter indicus TaxID=1477437 RepID=A0A1I3T718_9SPHI|nr:Na+/H+ antiporter [Parapedobacter indicus]PPK99602.1 CPA1 family monovalent cation:H+ antiporter [Parapedobacter indicus]SFJ66864.1 sodium/proton antiporter, CPA1 family [Parapedobacter indicus]
MIEHQLLLVLALFFAMALLYLLSQRINISYPIFLVIGGLGISFIPGVPNITIDPDLILLIFLPPLLFEAAWYTSWNNFWRWKRSILMMGFGLVFFTSLAIAYFSVNIIPGFTLALGFLLGGIISPPDAVAATSVLKGVSMPRRGLTILEGESLINDAASLTVFRFALAAIFTGQFVLQEAVTNFFVLAVMGVFVGLVVGHLLYLILRYWAKSSSITTPITLIAPYIMYIVAEELEWSGVLAVVSGGLFLSFRSKDYLNYHTRMQTKEVWETVGFLLNGFVFILIGLELPVIVEGLGGYSLEEAIQYGLLISAMVIAIRIILVYITAFVPRWLSPRVRARERSPGLKLPFIIGWAGMRGVVSLAAALAIPLALQNGDAFPQRNLILFITFVVILITLVFQGLTLPIFLRFLKVEEIDDIVPIEEQMESIRLRLAKGAVAHLDSKYQEEMAAYETIARIKEQLVRSIQATELALNEDGKKEEITSVRRLFKKISLELVELRRRELHRIGEEKRYDDEVIRDLEYNLDLEEARLNKQ